METNSHKYVDIHSHVLPGIDDGAVDWQHSLDMLRVAVNAGTTTIAATSHMPHGWRGPRPPHETGPRLVDELNQRAHDAGLPITVVTGMEIYLEPETAEHLEDGILLPLNGSRYALIETGFMRWTQVTEQGLDAVLHAGFTPVLAHPERNSGIQKNPEVLRPFIEQGVLGQVNAGSLLGEFGRRAQTTAHALFERGYAHLIAGDGHGVSDRRPDLTDARDVLSKRYGAELAMYATSTVPAAILADEDILVRDAGTAVAKAH